MALNPTALTKYSLQHLVTGEPEGACLILASSYMSSSVLSNNQASMIVRVCNTLSNISQDPF